MGLDELNARVKASKKGLHNSVLTQYKKRVLASLQWIILKKNRPPKLKYAPLPPRK